MSKAAEKKSKGTARVGIRVDHRHVRHALKLHTRMTSLEKLKTGWVDLKHDVKDAVSTLPALVKEFAMMKSMLRAGLGDQPISLRLSATLTITTTVTSGVTNTVSVGGGAAGVIDLTLFSEFSAVASLFDLAMVEGFAAEFIYNNLNAQGITMTANSLARIGYEVEGTSTPAASCDEIAQLAHNKAIPPKFVGVTTTNTGVTSDVVHHLTFPTPTGSAYPTLTAGQGNPGRSWVTIDGVSAGNGPFYGAIRFYHVGTVVTAIVTGTGVVYAYCKFKCRQ